jgi:release factor glutamine methyltransferase
LSRRPLASTTVREALDSAIIALSAAGCETPRLDAEILLATALGVDRGVLIAHPRSELTGEQARWFMDAARRRREREPVAYIVGAKGFRRLELQVDRRVLIPRPETEHLVEAALALARGARVVDVGTGSGAVALALKDERPDLVVFATDVSADALDVARANALRLGLDVSFVLGGLTAGLEVDAVVANPPYVERHANLMPEIARYEPPLALFGGRDGLAVVRELIRDVRAPYLALEHGEGQAPAIERLARAAGFERFERVRDLAGIERVLVAQRAGAARGAQDT